MGTIGGDQYAGAQTAAIGQREHCARLIGVQRAGYRESFEGFKGNGRQQIDACHCVQTLMQGRQQHRILDNVAECLTSYETQVETLEGNLEELQEAISSLNRKA
jgi:hypothetical protein